MHWAQSTLSPQKLFLQDLFKTQAEEELRTPDPSEVWRENTHDPLTPTLHHSFQNGRKSMNDIAFWMSILSAAPTDAEKQNVNGDVNVDEKTRTL